MIDRVRQTLEEISERGGIRGVEHRRAQRIELEACTLQSRRVASGDYHSGARGPSLPRRFEPDPRAAPDHDNGLA